MVEFIGGFSPGSSPAVVSFGGDVAFASSALLEAELAENDNSDPLSPCYDALAVAGDVTLSGTLSLCWLPVAGDANSRFGGAYTILTWGGMRTGAFAAVECEMAAYLDVSVFPDGLE